MTEEQIIKALEERIKALKDDYKRLQALDAPMDCFEESHIDNIRVLSNALDLINRTRAENENLKDILYDADGVNLVNYWHQQCKIAENGCRNFEEENKKQQAEIERLKNECFCLANERDAYKDVLDTAVVEALKEFANSFDNILAEVRERYAAQGNMDYSCVCEIIHRKLIKHAKELVGEDNG